MKNLFKILGASVVMLALSATSSFAQANPGGVEVLKQGDLWTLGFVCDGNFQFLSSEKVTMQFKNGIPHNIKVQWDVSGTCLQPAQGSGANVVPVQGPGNGLSITPSGKAHLNIIINPNQP